MSTTGDRGGGARRKPLLTPAEWALVPLGARPSVVVIQSLEVQTYAHRN